MIKENYKIKLQKKKKNKIDLSKNQNKRIKKMETLIKD